MAADAAARPQRRPKERGSCCCCSLGWPSCADAGNHRPMRPTLSLILLLLTTPQSLEHEKKGVQLLLSGRLTEARQELESCVRLDPNAASCHRHLGVIHAQNDDLARSIHHYKVYV